MKVLTMANGGLMYEASVGGQKFKFEAHKWVAGYAATAASTRPLELFWQLLSVTGKAWRVIGRTTAT